MFMMADEFERMVVDASLVNEVFVSRDVNVCFNLAMQTQVNEIEKDRHLKANLLEFMEALARVADKVSMAPPFVPREGQEEVCKLIKFLSHYLRTLCH
jgi:hypothetical protein